MKKEGDRHVVPRYCSPGSDTSFHGAGGATAVDGTVACRWLVGGGYSTSIDSRVKK